MAKLPIISAPDPRLKLTCKPVETVDDAVRTHAEHVLDLMAAGGITYVCGGAGTVAPALRDAFAEIYHQHHGVSPADGVAWLEEQRAANRYLEDVWAAH